MQTENRFFDDMARVASGALSGFTGLRQEVEARFREQIERILRYYVENVYPEGEGQPLGSFDAAQMQTVQDFYVENEIVNSAVPIEEVYTNEFVTE